jgi:RNA 2',3'-cyclic 3'-phosphodiesterase
MTRGRSDEHSEHWRVFAAIELPSNVQKRIQKQIQQLQAAVPGNKASWSRTENIHLTVKFFGNVLPKKIVRISEAASRVVNQVSKFKIEIGKTGAFPKVSQPRVLWIGVEDPTGELARLHQLFETECAVEGFDRETRDFRPHLTIARLRRPEGAKALAETNQKLGFESLSLDINELVVFRSEPSGKGSKYTALSRHGIK